jgi:tetratricopeptide (TPR) repeat protein
VLAMLDQAPVAEEEKTANLRFLAAELRDFAIGMKALDGNELDAAQAASAQMDAGLWRLQQEQADATSAAAKTRVDPPSKSAEKKDEPPMVPIMPDADSGPLVRSLSVASLELRAGVLAGQGKLEAAKKLYATAAKDEKSLGYHEPPLYIRPVGETEAVALLKAKDYAGAKAAYEAALIERPNSGFELYGLARVMELSGDTKGARIGYQEFLKAWPAADAGLAEVTHARGVLSSGTVASR